jgi:hypothetical protein
MTIKNTVLPKIIHVVGGTFPSQQTLNAVSQIDPVSSVINTLNANPYLIGVFYLFLNLGGRFVSLELTKKQEMLLANPFLRPFILFCIMFISTRNLAVAFWTTLGILSVLRLFANENSEFCLIPGWRETPVNQEAEDVYTIIMEKISKIPHEIEDNHHDVNSENTNSNPLNPTNDVEQYDDYS